MMKYYLRVLSDTLEYWIQWIKLWISSWSRDFASALIGALVGGAFTFAGVYYQMSQQRKIDENKKDELERDKMIYIHHLICDSGRNVEKFKKEYSDSVKYHFDIFSIDWLPKPFKNSGSLNALSNKINHEEYFLASLNQLHNENFGDIFNLFNSLYLRANESENHYNQQIPLLADEKVKVMNDTRGWFVEIKFYIDKYDANTLPPQRRDIYQKVLGILTKINQ